MMAIISSLNDSPIHRLNHTKAEVEPKVLKALEELHDLMTKEQNYQKYRQALKDATPPCIPYL